MPINVSFEPETNVMVFKLVAFWNAPLPIDVTEAGMIIDVKLEHVKNALLLIDITEDGIVIDFKLVQPSNAAMPIIKSCEPDANVTVSKLVQLMNAPAWISVTEAGIVIDVKPVQLLNALAPIDVTLTPPNILGITKGPAYVFGVNPVIVAEPDATE